MAPRWHSPCTNGRTRGTPMRKTISAIPGLAASALLVPAACGLAACDGSFAGGPSEQSDGGPAGPDATPVAPSLSITGGVHDFFDESPLSGALVSTDGLTPALSATSDTAGAYTIADLPE